MEMNPAFEKNRADGQLVGSGHCCVWGFSAIQCNGLNIWVSPD